MNNILNDTWEINGTDIEEFKRELKKFEKLTKVEEATMDDIYFLSISDMGTEYAAIPLHADSIWKKTKCALALKRFEIKEDVYVEKGYDKEAVSEAFNNGLFLSVSEKKLGPAKIKKMVIDGSYNPVSEKAISTISNRISHSGFGFFSERLIRDLSIAKKFCKPIPISLVSRIDPDTGLKKIFAVMSKKYTTIPQSIIIDILNKIMSEADDELGEAKCVSWNISHSVTRICIEFPNAGEELSEFYELEDVMVPGIMLETSDIGDCSLRIKGYFRMSDSDTIAYMENEYKQIHLGEINIEEILSAAKNEIFPKYTVYPERLAQMMTHDLVSESMNPLLRKKIISTLYRKISKKIGLVKAIGKNMEKALITQLVDAINPEIIYTAYDVAMTFLTLGKCVETDNKSVIEAISKTAPAVMQYDFGIDEEDDEILVV